MNSGDQTPGFEYTPLYANYVTMGQRAEPF